MPQALQDHHFISPKYGSFTVVWRHLGDGPGVRGPRVVTAPVALVLGFRAFPSSLDIVIFHHPRPLAHRAGSPLSERFGYMLPAMTRRDQAGPRAPRALHWLSYVRHTLRPPSCILLPSARSIGIFPGIVDESGSGSMDNRSGRALVTLRRFRGGEFFLSLGFANSTGVTDSAVWA